MRLQHRCSPVNFVKFLKRPFYIISPKDCFFTSTVKGIWSKLLPRNFAEAYLEPCQTAKMELLVGSGSVILQCLKKCFGGLVLQKSFEK